MTAEISQPTRQLKWDVYANSFARALEKREYVLCWLAEFHYSTRRVIAEALGLRAEGQGGFFKRLERDNLVRSVQVPTILERLILLTPNGLEHARALTARATSYTTEPSKITSSTVIHNLSVQLAALRMQRDVRKIMFERHLEFATRIKLPDAVVETDSGRLALEVELTHKNTARIYRAFIDSIQNIKEGHYARVRYIFHRKLLLDHYFELFRAPTWPYYDREPKSHRLIRVIRDGNPFSIDSTDPRIQSMFEFTQEDLYR